jgi:hypothetical protein
MSSNSETLHSTSVAAHSTLSSQTLATRKNSYSRKRWSTFDAWQEHVRKSAASVGVAFSERHDRDLRRSVVGG